MSGPSTKGQSELSKLLIENQKKDPGFNKKSKEMTEKMIKGKKYREVNDNPKDIKQDDKYRLMTEKNTAQQLQKEKDARFKRNRNVAYKRMEKGGRVEYKHGGGVGCAKRGFGKALKKGKK